MELWQIAVLCFAIGVLLIFAVKSIIRLTLGVKDFNYNHPEEGENEVFVTNAWEDDYYHIGWSTKRKGKQAYDIYGNPLKSGFPVFVKKSELEAAGFDITKFKTKWVNPNRIP